MAKQKQLTEVLITTGKENIRKLTRGDMRAWRRAQRDKEGNIDDAALEYSDDILIALSLTNGDGKSKYTVEEALEGCFDSMVHDDGRILIHEIMQLNRIGQEVTGLKEAVKN